MKGGSIVVAMLFVLTSLGGASAQVPGDQLIVPGERIGRWSLSMTFSELARAAQVEPLPYGPPDVTSGIQEAGWLSGPAGGLHAGYRGAQIEYLAVNLLSSFSPFASFKTAKDVGKDSTHEAVIAAYGPPTVQMPRARIVFIRAGVRLIFDGIGLAVGLSDGKVAYMEVFRPGRAREIWRF